jgi:hypothetical protein
MRTRIHKPFLPEPFALAGLGNGLLCLHRRKSHIAASLLPIKQRRHTFPKHRLPKKLRRPTSAFSKSSGSPFHAMSYFSLERTPTTLRPSVE